MFKLITVLVLFPISFCFAYSALDFSEVDALRGEEAIWLNSPRSLSFSSPPQGKRPINQSIDNFMSLLKIFPGLYENTTNLVEIDRRGLSQGSLDHNSWSYNSFPVYRGGLANRFADITFNSLENWKSRYHYYLDNKTQDIIDEGKIHLLSPIEKYELLIGSKNFILTEAEWNEGFEIQRSQGRIPTWFGSCHGTAPATLQHARPAKSIVVPSHNGFEKIVFTPSDIKALLAFSWAKNGGPSAVIGTRCESVGGTYSESCYDTNPGSFHLALSNLLGLHGKPVIIDAASGVQVWNRPIVKYHFRYFNPQTRAYTRKIEDAILRKEHFENDEHIKLRSKNYKKVVGVRAFVTYINDTEATDAPTDTADDDNYAVTTFLYDLELDEDNNILGGMWHERNFPDFMWVIAPEMLPLTREDRLMSRDIIIYDGKKPIPAYIRDLALRSSKRGQVSFRVIDMLLNLSK